MRSCVLPSVAATALLLDAAMAYGPHYIDNSLLKRSLRSHNQRRSPHHHQFVRRAAAKTTTTQPSTLGKGTATAEEGCIMWVLPTSGDTCNSVIGLSEGLTLADFYDLNPSIDSSCSNLFQHAYYCIATEDEGSAASAPCDPSKVVAAAAAVATGTNKVNLASTNKDTTSDSTTGSIVSSAAGLLQLTDQTCGSSGASATTSSEGGPNGKLSFLNCGISKSNPSSGWTPPAVLMKDVVYKDLDSLGPNSVFSACSQYNSLFDSVGAAQKIPPIFLAAFAMQESSCNPSATGDSGGAFGLMQITEDKCGGAPNGNCYDPAYNIATGAAYFRKVLDESNQNILVALGQYNGWNKGMSFSSATAAAYGECCECQNNLDYLHGFLNCYAQGISGSQCTSYNNLAVCKPHSR